MGSWAGSWGSGSSWGHGPHGRSPWGSAPPPWLQGLFGLAQQSHPRGSRVRRGDVRAAILDVLAVEPMNGYQIIQQIAERTGGAWKPSPGSVYPTVQQLEDEGLVTAAENGGSRTLRLTEQGERYVAEHPEELAATWRSFDQPSDTDTSDLKPVIGQVMSAVWQIVVSGTPAQRAEAAEVLAETRRRLYGLLAEGEPE
ncbi:MAG TPA: PadR family transcriptional regulator [Nocardioidaceae bacterium]|nr:PadR family transcriptional regulator [Nocardioidaceae bacterium]